MRDSPKSIRTLINSSAVLVKIAQQSQQQTQLEQTVRSHLSAPLNDSLTSCSLNGSQLTLFAQNAVQATILRLASQNLLQDLGRNNKFGQIKTIRVRIILPDSLTPPTARPAQQLNSDTAKLVGELAETVIDPHVKKILRRLSHRHKK